MQRLGMLSLMFTFVAAATAEPLTPQPGKQIATSITVTTTDAEPEQVDVPLLLYAPEDYAADGDAWPLVLFLHGRGECGSGGEELERVAIHGPAKQAAAGAAHPFVLLAPQCPVPDDRARVRGAWRAEVLLPLLDQVEQQLNIDRSRVYVTGLSMGGYGTWRLAATAPQRFAAAVPICGGGDPASVSANIQGLPIWAFHGAQDNVVPLSASEEMVDAVREAGGNVRLTVYPEANHDSWTQTYDNPMFYDWLLGERRAPSGE